MEQKWVLLDFGDGLGLDIVETQFLEVPKSLRNNLNNDMFDFEENKDVTFSDTSKKRKGQPAQRYTATVLLFGDSKSELKGPLDRVLQGKDIRGVESPLGRGRRQPVKNTRWISSDDDSDLDDEGPPCKKQMKEKEKKVADSILERLVKNKSSEPKKEKEKKVANSILERLVQNKSSEPKLMESTCNEQSHETLKQRVADLERENTALCTTLSLIKDLPVLVDKVGNIMNKINGPNTRPCTSRSESSSSACPSPKSSSSVTPKLFPRPKPASELLQFQPVQRDLKTSSGEILLHMDEMALLDTSTPRAMVNTILLKVFGRDVLITHSLLGTKCNLHKDPEAERPALPADKVKAVRDFVRGSFPGYTEALFNKHASEKLSNLRKKGKGSQK